MVDMTSLPGSTRVGSDPTSTQQKIYAQTMAQSRALARQIWAFRVPPDKFLAVLRLTIRCCVPAV